MESTKIVLSIFLLASNRDETVRKCVESLDPIRKEINSEVIILDTGCNEELASFLKDKADKYKTFKWCNDFAKARNAALEEAVGEWVLYIDDDEWFVDVCKCQYKNAQKVENKNVHFPMLYSSACVSKKDRFSLSRYDGPFIETICE